MGIFFWWYEKLHESKGYIYFWQLINYNEQDEYGDMSAKICVKAECEILNLKMKVSYHKMLMGKDYVKPDSPSKPIAGWQFPTLGSTSYAVLGVYVKIKDYFYNKTPFMRYFLYTTNYIFIVTIIKQDTKIRKDQRGIIFPNDS